MKQWSSSKRWPSPLQTHDRIQWLRKRVPRGRLIDRTVRMKYITPVSQMPEHDAITRVFKVFDENNDQRIEVDEVRRKFEAHKLGVSPREVKNLFRSAAVCRKPGEKCKDLTLYEFMLFSKSKSSAKSFQHLMEKLKVRALTMREFTRRNSKRSPGLKNLLSASSQHEADKQYLEKLPTSFNTLMLHFQDEERRNSLRASINMGMSQLVKNVGAKSNSFVVEDTGKSCKSLIQSHYQNRYTDNILDRRIATTKKFISLNKTVRQEVKNNISPEKSEDNLNKTTQKY